MNTPRGLDSLLDWIFALIRQGDTLPPMNETTAPDATELTTITDEMNALIDPIIDHAEYIYRRLVRIGFNADDAGRAALAVFETAAVFLVGEA